MCTAGGVCVCLVRLVCILCIYGFVCVYICIYVYYTPTPTHPPVGRILFEGVPLKVRWTMDLLHNKTWRTEFVCRVFVSNLLNLCAFLPSV